MAIDCICFAGIWSNLPKSNADYAQSSGYESTYMYIIIPIYPYTLQMFPYAVILSKARGSLTTLIAINLSLSGQAGLQPMIFYQTIFQVYVEFSASIMHKEATLYQKKS